VKIDLGSGPNKREGFIGVDVRQFQKDGKDMVDVICNLGVDKWPWQDETVEEAYCSHMVEHLKPEERVHFVNELHRVMKKGAKAQIITPHWASCRAYGDLTHQWPPVSEFWWPYLNAGWRAANAPHNDGYTCDFDTTYGFNVHQALVPRNSEFQQMALTWYKEAAQDMMATVIKR
jgi:hypothetical protein